MSDPSLNPQLVQAYKLLKAGERQQAGQLLKRYLAQHHDDPNAWWLMSHAVSTPEHAQKCLQNVLKLDPTHAKARAKLAALGGSPPPAPTPAQPAPPVQPAPPAAPQQPARVQDEEPDESLFLSNVVTDKRKSSGRKSKGRSNVVQPLNMPPKPRTSKPAAVPPSTPPPPATTPVAPVAVSAGGAAALPFAQFARSTTIERDPFSGQPVNDPFADLPDTGDPFALAANAPVSTTADEAFDDTFPLDDSGAPVAPAQGVADADASERPRSSARTAADQILALVVVGFSVFVLVMFVLYALAEGGSISLDIFSGGGTAMDELQASTFAIDYPDGWNQRCLYESQGYEVCGIANHAVYNEVDWFAGQEVNIGEMLSAAFSSSFGSNVPNEQVSIIVMDVPMTSQAYDNGSWAKTQYEYYQRGWHWDDNADVFYNGREDIVVDGYTAYYYKYTSEGRWNEAAWDVYIPHDGIVFWMRATFFANRGNRIPQGVIDDMIASIDINPAPASP